MSNDDSPIRPGSFVRVHLKGLSYSPLENGAFALLLSVEGRENLVIPIVIGSAEAQSIAIRMEHITTPRPMTHDLFASFAHAFGVTLQNVLINNVNDGIFTAEMTFTDGERTVTLDARTSDAIAVAMRSGAPIYATAEVIDAAAVPIVETPEGDQRMEHRQEETDPYEDMSVDELQERLNTLIDNENYEEAARVSALIDKKKHQ